MAKISYIIVAPSSEDSDVTLFQGWSQRLCHPEFLSILAAAALSPFYTEEIFLDQESLILSRSRGSKRDIIIIGDRLLDILPEMARGRFTIIFTSYKNADYLNSLDFGNEVRPLIATTKDIGGLFNIPFDSVINPVHILDQAIFEKLKEYSNFKGVLEFNKSLRGPYKKTTSIPVYGSGSTIANEFFHHSLGVSFSISKRIDSSNIDSFKEAIEQGCSGQQFPDTELSFSSATAGGTKPLY